MEAWRPGAAPPPQSPRRVINASCQTPAPPDARRDALVAPPPVGPAARVPRQTLMLKDALLVYAWPKVLQVRPFERDRDLAAVCRKAPYSATSARTKFPSTVAGNGTRNSRNAICLNMFIDDPSLTLVTLGGAKNILGEMEGPEGWWWVLGRIRAIRLPISTMPASTCIESLWMRENILALMHYLFAKTI